MASNSTLNLRNFLLSGLFLAADTLAANIVQFSRRIIQILRNRSGLSAASTTADRTEGGKMSKKI